MYSGKPDHLIDRRVKVVFTSEWEVPVGHYRLDGYDDQGLWLTRADGFQRYMQRTMISSVEDANDG